jgi:hypothetical protein
VARAWLFAPAVETVLWAVGVERTIRLIERAPFGAIARRSPLRASEGETLVQAAYRFHFVRGRCLPRAMLQYLLHRLEGTPARFVIGVRRPGESQGLEAHAWVEETDHPREVGYSTILDANDLNIPRSSRNDA